MRIYGPLWWEYTGDCGLWLPLAKDQWSGKCSCVMESSWTTINYLPIVILMGLQLTNSKCYAIMNTVTWEWLPLFHEWPWQNRLILLGFTCISGFPYIETEVLSFRQIFCKWLSHKLSEGQPPVQPVMKISSKDDVWFGWLIENTQSHGCIYLSLIMRPYYRWYVRMATLCSNNINWIDHIQGIKSVHLSMTVVTAIWHLSSCRLCRNDKSSMTTFELQ